jgi:thioredoxin 1
MLQTNLKHILSRADFDKVLAENENVMICCGRMILSLMHLKLP